MQPTEGTRRALDALGDEGRAVEADLQLMAERARRIVPELVGLALADLESGLSFTLDATDTQIASLDAMQYLDGGPCVAGAHEGNVVEVRNEDLLAEDRWLVFAHATAAAGVASTLTLPIVERRRVVGTINLYASTPDAFAGHHDDLADVLGASALGAVTNADLSFSTRLDALRSAHSIEEQQTVDAALEIIVARHQVDLSTAEERLRDAALRAGVRVVDAARALQRAFEDHE